MSECGGDFEAEFSAFSCFLSIESIARDVMSAMLFDDSVTELPSSMARPHSSSAAYAVLITSEYLNAVIEIISPKSIMDIKK